MIALDQTLATIRERIGQHQGKGISEEATKTALVNPLLRALGWDTEDLHQVYPEYPSVGGRVDYALLIKEEPRLLIEAKALDANLDDLKWVTQLTTYAVTTGVRWTVLTNGDEYRIYNAYAQVSLEEKLFHTVQLDDREPRAVEILNLLSRSAVLENRLDSHWQVELETRRQQRVNQQLQSTLQALVDQDPPNEPLVRLVRNQPDCQLAPGDIREGLRRARVRFELPAASKTAPDPTPSPVTKPSDSAKRGPPHAYAKSRGLKQQRVAYLSRQHPEVRVDGPAGETWVDFEKLDKAQSLPRPNVPLKRLVEAGTFDQPLEIHKPYKGQRLIGHIEADGAIAFQGHRYTSLNAVTKAARTLHGDSPTGTVSGWIFWEFTDADGRDQPLSLLRNRYLEQRAPE